VLDRLIQQAIQQVLTPVFDPEFSDSSHGFRPNRSAHGAAKQVQRTIRRGRRFWPTSCWMLRLVVNLEKSRIVPTDGIEFLGFVFRGVTGAIHVSEKNVRKCKRRIRELTGWSRGISMTQRLGELRRYLQGWAGYFALAAQMRPFENLGQWIRRRLRMCIWKRWPFVRTRVQNLLTLGVPRRQAFRHAKSRKGPWHMAKTIASGVAMTNAWLQDQGLVSLKSLWIKRAPLRRTA